MCRSSQNELSTLGYYIIFTSVKVGLEAEISVLFCFDGRENCQMYSAVLTSTSTTALRDVRRKSSSFMKIKTHLHITSSRHKRIQSLPISIILFIHCQIFRYCEVKFLLRFMPKNQRGEREFKYLRLKL